MSKSNSKRFWILLVVLLIGGGIINVWERAGEAKISRKSLKEFPSQFGSWRQSGADTRFDAETERFSARTNIFRATMNPMAASCRSMRVTTLRNEPAQRITARSIACPGRAG